MGKTIKDSISGGSGKQTEVYQHAGHAQDLRITLEWVRFKHVKRID